MPLCHLPLLQQNCSLNLYIDLARGPIPADDRGKTLSLH